ncbi:MAG: hypothetical protein M1836_004716 [Candelina mexicana]|nr:MAG: hypothetical protein M1836_004716 [Candelina mexicana]
MEPILIEDELAPRFIFFNHVNNPSIAIDLEKDDDDEQGFKQGDYFSDEDINQLFLKHSEDFLLQSGSEVQASTTTKRSLVKEFTHVSTAGAKSVPLSSFQSNGYTIKAGKSTIELNDGDFFHIKKIQRYADTEVIIQGHRLRRVRNLVGVERKRNELAILLRVDKDDSRDPMVQGMESLRLEGLGGIRKVIFTNKKYSKTSYRDDPENQKQSSDWVESKGRLFCRQKLITTIHGAKYTSADTKPYETCLQFLNEHEADEEESEKNDELRKAWRGETVAGGACSVFLEGEIAFNEEEVKAVHEAKARSLRSFSRSNRVSIADHTCGRGAVPSTPTKRSIHQLSTPGSRDDPIKLGDDLTAQYSIIIDLSREEESRLHLENLSLESNAQDPARTSRKRSRGLNYPNLFPTPPYSRHDNLSSKRQRHSNFDDTPIHCSLPRSQDTLATQSKAKPTSSQSHYLPGLSTSTAEIHTKTSKVMSSLPSHRRSSTTASASQQRYVFGDAFCGAGGASRGAKMAGLRVAWGNDFDIAAIDSYRRNFFETQCHAMWAHQFINEIEEDHKVDILHISPPCQVFSPAHTTEGKDDEMNTQTFFACQELLRRTKPRLATMENTFGLIQNHPEFLASAVSFFTSLGYSVRWKISNFAEYGLPQARRRAFFIAACPGEALPDFPAPTHSNDPEKCRTLGLKPFVTVNEAIRDIPLNFPNHDIKEATRARTPYDGNKQLSRCITTSGGDNYHPSGIRGFTDREFACLQGFPLEHKFGKTRVKKQIGNAVPPSVALVIFKHLKNALLKADGLR